MSADIRAFATCPRGLESLLIEELRELNVVEARETIGGVRFEGGMREVYNACLWTRTSSRVLLPLTNFEVDSQDALYEGVRRVEWEDHIPNDGTIAVDFNGKNVHVRNTQFGAQRAKDAVVDRLRDIAGWRPSVDRMKPDIRINIHLKRSQATVAIDLSGDSLHRRLYRQTTGHAPLKENLAAGVLLRARWPEIARDGGALLDPMCGSGTLIIEGLMMAADIAPGLKRRHWGFNRWLGHVPALWRTIQEDAKARKAQASAPPPAFGYDAAGKAIAAAKDNAYGATVGEYAYFRQRDLKELVQPTHQQLSPGLIVTNPPYGERLGDTAALSHLYSYLGERLHAEFTDWSAAVLTGNEELAREIGLRSHRQYKLYNGPIESRLFMFNLSATNELRRSKGVSDAPSKGPSTQAVSQKPLSEGAQMFANRLTKNVKRLKRWRDRAGVSCYRVYDADMPEYAIAVDVYNDWAHIAEYQAPKSVDERAASQRLEDALSAVPHALGLNSQQVVLKRRTKQRGSQQYVRQNDRGDMMEVAEGDVKLLVNLHDYLDTGLFLDHRKARRWIYESSQDKRVLNLFCYTGSVTVHAAMGNARRTVSVDTSSTYLQWARKNLAVNGLGESRNALVKEDVRKWLAQSDEQFDIIFLDPPTFSNTKGGRTFDVQRDHADLIDATMARLTPGGTMLFSTNRRGFKLDESLNDQYAIDDRTGWSLDDDFSRQRRAHLCWFFQHRDDDVQPIPKNVWGRRAYK